MNLRIAACVVLALGYAAWRLAPISVAPAPPPMPAVAVPCEAVGKLTAGLPADDRVALRESYITISRAVASDPPADRVFPDTAAVRRAHRAALLFVWRGLLDNKAGEVEGLREALEAAVESRIGAGDIPMNPAIQADAAKAFADIAASVR